ncbi:hypothetical protein AgCh_000968 [Apium graveolens]
MPAPISAPPSFLNMPTIHMNVMPAQNLNAQFANMPFEQNPYYATFNMPQMPFSMSYWNNMFAHNMPFHVNQPVHDNSAIMNGFHSPTLMTKVESQSPKTSEKKPRKSKKKANKDGAKETWERADPSITFRDDNKGYTLGCVLISKDNVIIEEVALVDGLKHNLLNVIQLCDKGNSVTFNSEACVLTNNKNNKVVLTGVRKGNMEKDNDLQFSIHRKKAKQETQALDRYFIHFMDRVYMID